MNEIPRISGAEWEVMKICWANSPCSAQQIIEALSGQSHWKDKTIKTLLNRLVQKGALGYRKEGRTYHYYPLLSEEECIEAESESFLDRVFGGALKPALAHFIQRHRLTPDDIEDLKKMLDKEGK